MSEWNERIEKANTKVVQYLTQDQKMGLTFHVLHTAIRTALTALKEPEPAEKETSEKYLDGLRADAKYDPVKSLVHHPDGRTWAKWPDGILSPETRESFGLNPIEPMTPAEAFRNGAIVQYTKGDFVIQGKAEMEDNYVSIIGGQYRAYGYGRWNITLVKPAPETSP